MKYPELAGMLHLIKLGHFQQWRLLSCLQALAGQPHRPAILLLFRRPSPIYLSRQDASAPPEADPRAWNRCSLLNSARSGYFLTPRPIDPRVRHAPSGRPGFPSDQLCHRWGWRQQWKQRQHAEKPESGVDLVLVLQSWGAPSPQGPPPDRCRRPTLFLQQSSQLRIRGVRERPLLLGWPGCLRPWRPGLERIGPGRATGLVHGGELVHDPDLLITPAWKRGSAPHPLAAAPQTAGALAAIRLAAAVASPACPSGPCFDTGFTAPGAGCFSPMAVARSPALLGGPAPLRFPWPQPPAQSARW